MNANGFNRKSPGEMCQREVERQRHTVRVGYDQGALKVS